MINFYPHFSTKTRNIFKEGELKKSSVIRNFRITASDGKTYDRRLRGNDSLFPTQLAYIRNLRIIAL